MLLENKTKLQRSRNSRNNSTLLTNTSMMKLFLKTNLTRMLTQNVAISKVLRNIVRPDGKPLKNGLRRPDRYEVICTFWLVFDPKIDEQQRYAVGLK